MDKIFMQNINYGINNPSYLKPYKLNFNKSTTRQQNIVL